ncbi:MAG TPA: hypothetical protein VFP33_06215 [Gallionella sp.]|nr:hypothetical protein [Gallionella sp.]
MEPLKPAAEEVLNRASASAIANALSRLGGYFQQKEWLDPSNPYRRNAADRVNELCKSGNGPFTDDQLVECIAASSVLHLFEGWSYLSQAVGAAVRGDVGIVRHLSYYAELRASIALLASQGVGVFKKKHVVVNDGGQLETVVSSNAGTHEMAWLALQHWGRKQESGQLICKGIRAFGYSLGDWVDTFQGATTNRITGAEWTAQWGFDLKQFVEDQETRNEVSYRANFNFETRRLAPVELTEWISDLWQLSNPLATSFELLDQYLVRSALKRSFNTKFQADAEESYEARISSACRALKVATSNPTEFFCGRVKPNDPLLLVFASKTSSVYDDLQYMEVISRAYLLLRLATACVIEPLKKANISKDDFSFWWQHIGNETGLWPRNNPPDDPIDLWYDVEVSLEAIASWKNEQSSDVLCWKSFHQHLAADIDVATRLERAAIWGVA